MRQARSGTNGSGNGSGAALPLRHIYATGDNPVQTIGKTACSYDMVIMGAGGGDGADIGPLTYDIAAASTPAMVLVKTRLPIGPAIQEARRRARPHALHSEELSLLVDKWFAENTFHANEFSDLARLVEIKRQRNLTISVGLPALNEEETIGGVIEVLKEHLMDRIPLVDELVVIDSNSTDKTREIAQSMGMPVHIHQSTLPEAGEPLDGKGEALWKSLHVLKGDIIAWVDTDVTNMHPQFVYGLIGPLLMEPRLGYVKGYYHRPFRTEGKMDEEGGGRVTELTVRPLLNLFFPLLSGVVQPLAGEYAGRREVLEQLPFFSGYGVETGLLIDLLPILHERASSRPGQPIPRHLPSPRMAETRKMARVGVTGERSRRSAPRRRGRREEVLILFRIRSELARNMCGYLSAPRSSSPRSPRVKTSRSSIRTCSAPVHS